MLKTLSPALTPIKLVGKNIILFDDICDSYATVKEIGKLLTAAGAEKIAPLVIAKTVGGDLV
jgi:ATP-dependent DNA helicase RecQ